LSASTVIFNVSSWSNYSIGESKYLTSCTNITSSGTYYLTQNIIDSNAGICFNISANNVVLDCQGNLMDSDDADSIGDYGIYVYRGSEEDTNINITNCTITNWGNSGLESGIYLANAQENKIEFVTSNNNYRGITLSQSDQNTITNITTNNNDLDGMFISFSANNTITNITTQENQNRDFYLSPQSITDCNNIITNITGSGNRPINYYNQTVFLENETLAGLILCNADNSDLKNITIQGSDTIKNNQMDIMYTINTNLSNINSSNNEKGILFSNSNQNILNNSIFRDNDDLGIQMSNSEDNILENLTTYNNGDEGISLTGSSENNYIININSYNNVGEEIRDATSNTIKQNFNYKNQYGTITWTDTSDEGFLKNLDVQDNLTFPGTVKLENNSAYLNASHFITDKSINSSANITLYGIDAWGFSNPVVLRDGVECDSNTEPSCWNFTSLNAGTVSFNVSSWSNYSIGEDPHYLTNCTNIISSGTYYLTQNITNVSANACFNISADDVVLDCQGHEIDANSSNSDANYGVYIYRSYTSSKVNITNCTITDWDLAGIDIYRANQNRIEHTITNNNLYGIRIQSSNKNTIINITTQENDYNDLYLYVGSSVSYCYNTIADVNGSGNRPIMYYNYSVDLQDEIYSGLIMCDADNSNLENITIQGSDTKQNNMFEFLHTDNTNLSQINSSNNYWGIRASYVDDNKITDAEFSNNNQYGLYLANSEQNKVKNITIDGNGLHGVYLSGSDNNNLTNITATNNNYGLGFSYSDQNRVTNVTTINNQYGLFFSFSDGVIISNLNSEGNSNKAITDNSNDLYIQNFNYENQYGIITWTDFSDAGFLKDMEVTENVTFPGTIKIGNNSAFLNASYYTTDKSINSSANITLYGIDAWGFSDPVVLRDGEVCDETTEPSCWNFTSLSASTVEFNVSSWSNYSIGEEPVVAGEDVCGTLDVANTVYTLTTDVSSSGDCFNVTVDNVTLDCAGHSITGQRNGIGVNVTYVTNVTVRNCLIKNYSRAIHLENINLSLFDNNTIRENNGTVAVGIFFRNSLNNSVTNSLFFNNSVFTNDMTSVSNAGIHLNNSDYNRIENNSFEYNIVRFDGQGNARRLLGGGILGLQLSEYNEFYNSTLVNNDVRTLGNFDIVSGGGIVGLFDYSRYNEFNITVIENNVFNGSNVVWGGVGIGIYSFSSDNVFADNLIINNTLITSDSITGGIGIGIRSASNNNVFSASTISNNNITNDVVYGGLIGIVSANSNIFSTNTISNNNITSVSVSGGVGIGVNNNADNNHFTNSTIFNNTITISNSVYGGGVIGLYLNSDDNVFSILDMVDNNVIVPEVIYGAAGLGINRNSHNNSFSFVDINNSINKGYGIGIDSLSGSNHYASYNNKFINITLDRVDNGSLYIGNLSNSMFNQTFANVTLPTNVFFENGNGSVNFTTGINFTSLVNLYDVLSITNNSVDINTSAVSGMNRTAVIALNNIGTFSNPAIIRNGNEICTENTQPSCNNFTSLNAGTVEFNVSSWTNYSVGEGLAVVGEEVCGVLNVSNAIYTLTTDVNSSGICFNITAQNVTLDCAGHMINYSQNGLGYGVENDGFDNTTIINCVIVEGGSTSASYAMRFGYDSRDINITNNSIITVNSNSHGIYLYGSDYIFVIDNIINSSAHPISLESSSDASIRYNTLFTDGGFMRINGARNVFINNSFVL